MNCEDAEASIVTEPPADPAATAHGHREVAGAVVVDLGAEAAQRVDDRPHRPHPGLRRRRRGATGPSARAATAGRKRITVPARPQSMRGVPARGPREG